MASISKDDIPGAIGIRYHDTPLGLSNFRIRLCPYCIPFKDKGIMVYYCSIKGLDGLAPSPCTTAHELICEAAFVVSTLKDVKTP